MLSLHTPHSQGGEYCGMYLNFPSLWVLVSGEYGTLRFLALSMAACAAAAGVCRYLSDRRPWQETLLPWAAWFVWAMLPLLAAVYLAAWFHFTLRLWNPDSARASRHVSRSRAVG